jgi:hypothetical protein
MSKLKRRMWAARCQADRRRRLSAFLVLQITCDEPHGNFALCIWAVYTASVTMRKSDRSTSQFKEKLQDRRCTYNVTIMRVPAIVVVAVEKQSVVHNLSVCVCSLRYSACQGHAPYCHVRPAPL